MKLLNNYKLLFVFAAAIFCNNVFAQEESKPKLLIDVVYHLIDNKIPYVTIYTKSKIEKKFVAVPNITVKVFLGEESDANLLGTTQTNEKGRGFVSFPVGVKTVWDSLSQFKIIATSVANKQFESSSNEASLTKAKIFIDTLNVDGVRSLVATVKAKTGNEWLPVKDVETKLIVKRSVGNLSVGDAETYTTDSTGQATAEFKKTGIPGDNEGNIFIVAKTEESELYGSLSIEEKVKWGSGYINESNDFNRRTLFATRDKAPIWLLLLAGSIFVTVWATIVYLIKQILKIKKVGLEQIPT
jgi:hypothetical protein